MKRGRPSMIHEPSAYRNGDAVGVIVKQKLQRPAKRRKCSRDSSKRADCPMTALNVKRRVLRYAPQDQVCIIPNRRQISFEERNATWLTMKEFRRIQKESAEMIERMEASNSKHHYESFSSLVSAASGGDLVDPPPITPSFNTEEEPVLVPSSPSSNNSEDDTKDDGDDESNAVPVVPVDCCVRGLEQHTKLYLATKLSVQRLVHETVEKIRILEAQDGKNYGHVLAQLCQVCSATAIANARVLGERDAQEAAATGRA